jgi:hypothetical protein
MAVPEFRSIPGVAHPEAIYAAITAASRHTITLDFFILNVPFLFRSDAEQI